MKRVFSFLLALALIMPISNVYPSFNFNVESLAQGIGTPEDPIIITTRIELENIKNNLSLCYKLGADIDLQNAGWTPIGTTTNFTGQFDGAGYKIKNVSILNSSLNATGFFSRILNATIKNLTIENVSITSANGTVGAIAGSAHTSTISGCGVIGTGSISGSSSIGGLAGLISNSLIENSFSKIQVSSTIGNVGGLIGYMDGGTVKKSYGVSSVTSVGQDSVGGVVGYLYGRNYNSLIQECYFYGDLTGRRNIGGIVGKMFTALTKTTRIENCFVLGNIYNTDYMVGGIVGDNWNAPSSFNNCYASVTIAFLGSQYIGGVAGSYPDTYSTITNCYFNSEVGVINPVSQGRTVAQMMQIGTYTGWDFNNIWGISDNNSFPYLKALEIPDHVNMPSSLTTPTNLREIEVTQSSISIAWDSVPEATSYDVEIDGLISNDILTTTYNHTNLQVGEAHTYRVRAVKDGRYGGWSEFITLETPIGIPSVPSNVIAGAGVTAIELSWDMNSQASSFEIEIDGSVVNVGKCSVYIHNNLNANEQHTYRIRAKNSLGESDWSQLIIISTLDALETPVITAKCKDTSIELNWDEVIGATGYELEIDGISSIITDSQYVHSDLLPVSSHSYRIRTLGNGGISEWSEILQCSTLAILGSAENPFVITTKQELIDIGNNLSAYYVLGNDIDLQNEEWIPIKTFTGNLNGNDFRIKNLKISTFSEANYVGLFGWIKDATLKNIIIENVDISNTKFNSDGSYTTGSSYVGALVGYSQGNNSRIENCSVENGQVFGLGSVGGLIGYQEGGTILNSSSGVNVTGGSNCGGLVGRNGGSINKCFSTGDVKAFIANAGGLIGAHDTISTGVNTTIEECYATGNVCTEQYSGGLIGRISTSYKTLLVNNCFSIGEVTSNYRYGGGFVGNAAGTYSIQLKNSFSSGTVIDNNPSFPDRYSLGFLGYASSSVTITNCFYDALAAQRVPSVDKEGLPKLTTAMKKLDTFINWDFANVWGINENQSYPYLKNLAIPVGIQEGLPQNEVAGGNGTIADPYLIATSSQLQSMKYDVKAYYKLINDIDLQAINWTPIGMKAPFTGTLDGDGYKISNLKIYNNIDPYLGFFSKIDGGTIKNLTIENFDISDGSDPYDSQASHVYGVGALVGYATSTVNFTIDNCHIKNGIVKAKGYCGGLIGQSLLGTISNCSFEGSVIGATFVGGLVGYCNSNVKYCSSKGDVTATSSIGGGLIGIFGSSCTSGLTVEESYAIANVDGKTKLGGLIGNVSSSNQLKNIYNCYAKGTVLGESYLGGLVGQTTYSYKIYLKNCYSSNTITVKPGSSGSYVNGLIGSSYSTTYVVVTSSYFDSTVCGKTTPTAQARTTSQMSQQSNYISWDFSAIWMMKTGETYPLLRKIENRLQIPAGLTVVDVTCNSIDLSWSTVPNATEYEIEVNESTIIQVGAGNTFTLTNLQPGSLYRLRIRAKNATSIGNWNSKLSVITPLEIPTNLTAQITSNTEILVSWGAVEGATNYLLEINGEEICVTGTSYIQSGYYDNTQYIYRIKAMSSITDSKWSPKQSVITWQAELPAVCMTLENQKTTIDDSNLFSLVLKGHNLTNLYTIQLELKYDPTKLMISEEQIEDLVFSDIVEKYSFVELDSINGEIKIMLSITQDMVGKSGDVDIVRITGDMLQDILSELEIKEVKLVDSDARYINVTNPQATNVWLLSER